MPQEKGPTPPEPPANPRAGMSPGASELALGVAVGAGTPGVVTARKAGGLRDLKLEVDPDTVGVVGALQHLAKAVNIAFQTDFGENELESVYQAAVVVNKGEVRIIHKAYFGFRPTWFGQFGRLLTSLQLTFTGPDPASPEGQARLKDSGAATIRGLLNAVGRKLDLVAEYEDRVPAYVAQMFDRLEASGIIEGWDRDDWEITTTRVGLDIRVAPRDKTPKPQDVQPKVARKRYPPVP
jgi:hypothetical protein